MPSSLEWAEAPLLSRMAVLRSGAPASWIRQMEQATGLSRSALCSLLGLRVSTINRKLHNLARLSADETERLMGLLRLLGQV